MHYIHMFTQYITQHLFSSIRRATFFLSKQTRFYFKGLALYLALQLEIKIDLTSELCRRKNKRYMWWGIEWFKILELSLYCPWVWGKQSNQEMKELIAYIKEVRQLKRPPRCLKCPFINICTILSHFIFKKIVCAKMFLSMYWHCQTKHRNS
jgi:hypothetical protein